MKSFTYRKRISPLLNSPMFAIVTFLLAHATRTECLQIGYGYTGGRGRVVVPVVSKTSARSAFVPPCRKPAHINKARALFMQVDESNTNDGISINAVVAKSGVQEAERLRQKAKELMNEAITAENALRSSKQQAEKLKNTALDEIFDDLTCGILTDVVVEEDESEIDRTTESELNRRLMNNLRDKRLSSTKMIQLIERLHERSIATEKKLMAVSVNTNGQEIENGFNIGDMANSREYMETELQMLKWNIDRIIDAQGLLDTERTERSVRGGDKGLASVLEARLRDLRKAEEESFQRKLAMKFNERGTINTGVGEFVQETMGDQNVTIKIDGKEFTGSKVNMTRLMEDIVQVPMWVPSSILPFVIVCRKDLDPVDLKRLRAEVLTGSQFKVENSDFTRLAAIYRGSFLQKRRGALYGAAPIAPSDPTSASEKTTETQERRSEVVFDEVQDRLKEAGLADKIQLFLMEDPEWRPGDRDPEPLPSILAVSSEVIPEQGYEREIGKKFVAGLSILGTFIATFAYAVAGFALNPGFFDAVVNNNDISKLISLAPIVLGVFGISVIHDAAHQIAASKSDVKIGLPVPLPSLQIGTFGSITPLRSFPKTRKALFDVAMSGPLVGALVSIACMISGISMTVHASSDALTTFAVVPAVIMKTSVLVGSFCSIMAPKVMALPASQLIPVHPLFLVGFAGLISSALNLLPIGRLDGGRATTAVLGRRSAYLVSFATLLFLAIAALTQTSAISIFFGLLVTLFQRNAEIPMRDELTDVDDARVGVYIFSILLTVVSLAPFPGGPAL